MANRENRKGIAGKRFLRRLLAVLFAAALCVSLLGCVPTKTVHCDGCGKELKIAADSNMTEDWTIFCRECEVALGLDKVVEERP